ncbi:hypothetical protein LCGC14_2472600 [marine sediment metagenome]|uniref:C2H2-type domain-containing protein n=1 Tax=marine sediment metagenome TaxID=412755 RepID=A0A0F9BAQ8_9ZZZZ
MVNVCENKRLRTFTAVILYENLKTNKSSSFQKIGLKSLANFCPICGNLLGLRKEANGKFISTCSCGYYKILRPNKINPNKGKRSYICSFCGKVFSQKESYLQHCRDKGHNITEIFKDYKKQGISLDKMIKIENNHKSPKGLRNLILSFLIKMMYNFKCQVCKKNSEIKIGDKIEVHHIIPLLKNGKDHSDNLIVLCQKHHRAIHEGVLNMDFNKKFIYNNYNNKNIKIKLDLIRSSW